MAIILGIDAVLGFDCMAGNIGTVPKGHQLAGYTTGTDGTGGTLEIRWTEEQFAAHPGTVRICQDLGATDVTADVLDVEQGAATMAEAARWYKDALRSYTNAIRPGQRRPAIYINAANVTPLVNALIANGVGQGPRLWVAKWDFSQGNALDEIAAAGGPFPIVGAQFASGPTYDTDVFSSQWLSMVSGKTDPPPPTGTGPYLQEMNGLQSLTAYAAGRNTTALELWDLSVKSYTHHDLGVLFGEKLPKGWRIYTKRP